MIKSLIFWVDIVANTIFKGKRVDKHQINEIQHSKTF